MTAIKKTTTKTAKSPAPATKVAVVAPAKSAKATSKKTAAPVASGNGASHAAIAPAVTAPKPATAAKPVTAPKPVAVTKTATTIQARIDVGFGNTLYIRGEGPGLSWDKGVLMDCVGQDQWQIGLGESARPFAVKFLVNDITWSTGPDYIVPSGVNVTFAPQF